MHLRLSPDALRAAREAAGLTQEQAAVAVGVALRTLWSAEVGRTEPRVGALTRMASVYGVSIEAFFVIHDEEQGDSAAADDTPPPVEAVG